MFGLVEADLELPEVHDFVSEHKVQSPRELTKATEIKQQIEENKGFAWRPSSTDDLSSKLRHIIAKARDVLASCIMFF